MLSGAGDGDRFIGRMACESRGHIGRVVVETRVQVDAPLLLRCPTLVIEPVETVLGVGALGQGRADKADDLHAGAGDLVFRNS